MRYLMICLVLLITALPVRSDEPGQTSAPDGNWNFASLPCSSCGYPEIAYDNTLYFMDNGRHVLTVLRADGSPAIQLDTGEISRSIESTGIWFIIAIDRRTVVFESFLRHGAGAFVLDIETQAVQRLPSGVICSYFPTRITMPLDRIGTKRKIITCDVTQNNVLEIHITDLDNPAATVAIPTLKYSRDFTPWRQMRGGLDGQLYLLNYGPQVYPLPEATLSVISRYHPETEDWKNTAILKSWLSRIPADVHLTPSIAGIDESGHIYYVVEWIELTGGGTGHFELLKVSPEGELLWHLTEADSSDLEHILRLLPNGYFLVHTAAGYSFIQPDALVKQP